MKSKSAKPRKFKSAFERWLYTPEPHWKERVESCDERLFKEIHMDKYELISLITKLEEYEIFQDYELKYKR